VRFRELAAWRPRDSQAATIKLGVGYQRAAPTHDARRVEDVQLLRNIFDHSHPAIAGDGLPVQHLFITYNDFGAYDFGIIVRGDRFNTRDHFVIADAVIAFNIFKPGSYLDAEIRQGAIASQLGGSYRMDFSNNFADGTSREYLDGTGNTGGWRAAFFWNLTGNHELGLISHNVVTCSGDEIGDGEGIAFDNDGNTFAFGTPHAVLAATGTSVTVEGPLKTAQNHRPVGEGYYAGHYLQVVAGPGLGQVRRVASYVEQVPGGAVRFKVDPAWDVPPREGSQLVAGREFWQVYVLGNLVDQRSPPCAKSNRSGPKGGVIGLWAQTADVVVAGNRQYDTDGILVNQNFNADDPRCPDCYAMTFAQSFLDIRDNLIDGEYDWSSDCSHSGIYLANSAAPTSVPPPTLSYGVAVSHNHVVHADGLRGGGIVVPLTWHQGPPPHNWRLAVNLLIDHNRLEDLDGPPPRHVCDNPQSARVGINLYQAEMVWRTVLYANSCHNVTVPLHDGAQNTIRVCPSPVADSCECDTGAHASRQ
jgi:hypothetical protein